MPRIRFSSSGVEAVRRRRAILNRSLILAVGAAVSLSAAERALAGSNFTWAAATSGNWGDAIRWNPNGVPDVAGDSAVIDATGAAYTVTLNINPTLDFFTLNSSDATVSMVNRVFTATLGSTLSAGTIEFFASTWNGAALVNGATINFRGDSTINTPGFTNNGNVTLIGVPGAHAQLNLPDGSVNNGTWTVSSTTLANANISVAGNGAFTNSATGVFNIQQGASGGRTYNWVFNNLGTLNIDASNATFQRTNATHTNNGDINISAGNNLIINASGQTFEQAGGTLDIDPDGLLQVLGATYLVSGGTTTGNVLVADGTATFNGGSGGTVIFRGGSNTLRGDLGATQSVLVRGVPGFNTAVTSEDGFTNSGTLTFTSTTNATANLTAADTGVFINNASGVINIEPGAGGARTYSWNLTNNGTLNVNAATTTFQRSGAVMANNGVFNVNSGGTLTINASGQRFDQSGGTLTVDPSGLFHVQSAGFRQTGGTVSGSVLLTDGTLDLAWDGGGTFIMRGGSNTLLGDIGSTQTVLIRGEPSFNSAVSSEEGMSNDGILAFNTTTLASANLTAQGTGLFTNNTSGHINIEQGSGGPRTYSWALNNFGEVNVNANNALFQRPGAFIQNYGTYNIDAAGALTINGSAQTFAHGLGVINVEPGGLFHVNSAAFRQVGGIVNGEILLTDSSGDFQHTGGDGGGHFIFRGGSNFISGRLDVGQTVTLRGQPSFNSAITSADGFINAGTFNFNSTTVASSNLTGQNGGLFTNSFTGVINIEQGSGGPRTYSWNLDNYGDVNVNADNTIFQRADAFIRNFGTFDVTSVLTINGSSQTFEQRDGTLTVNPGAFMNVASARFRHLGGAVVGNVQLTNSTLSLLDDGDGGGNFFLRGGSNLIEGISTFGQTVSVRGEPSFNSASDVADGFINNGIFNLTSTTVASANISGVGVGRFNNGATGVLNVEAGSGGPRVMSIQLDNDGLFNVNAVASLSRGNSFHTNSGVVQIQSGASLTVTGDTFTNEAGGVIKGHGVLNVASISLVNNGSIEPGLSIGGLDITGILNQGPSGALGIELAGSAAGQFDQLRVSGAANLDGVINVSFLNDYVPAVGDTFLVLTFASRTGAFDGVVSANPGIAFDVIYNTTNATLIVTAVPAPGAAAMAGLLGLAAIRRRRR
ncbi:MAG TPA: hypothetical protein VG797_02950 [Phycisphaerales bacterium]|nr:hypothetical protein [Phycisphaerales bacterium]